MPKMRTFLWKSPEWDGPVARMTYDPDKDEFHVYINMDYPDNKRWYDKLLQRLQAFNRTGC